MESPQSRRQFLKEFPVRFSAAAVAGLYLSEGLLFADNQPVSTAKANLQKPIEPMLPESHLLDETWPSLAPPSYPEPCQITGVAIAKDGTILALNHGENHSDPALGYLKNLIKKPAVLVIDPKTGKLLRSWGSNLFILPHHISVDAAGNVWVVDGALKSVFKFDGNGVKLLEIKGADVGFQMPSDVAFFKDGSFLVADGSITKRALRFDAEGTLLGEWGEKGEGLAQFHTPHSIAIDDSDLVYIADRENRWVQVLDAEGELKATWRRLGRPSCVRFHSGSIWVLSNFTAAKGIVRRFNLKGELLEAFHTKPAASKRDFEWPHCLAVTEGGNTVYVGFILTSRQVVRYRRKQN